MLRPLDSIPYIPMLGLRPAEMQALGELPLADKKRMMPLIQLGPWASAHHLHSAIAKIEDAYTDIPCFVSIAEVESSGVERPVHAQLAALRDPAGGYDSWCKFIEERRQFVPTLQIADTRQIVRQAGRLYSLGRGLMILIERGGFSGAGVIARAVSNVTDGGAGVCFMLDYGRATRDFLSMTLHFQGHVTQIVQQTPKAHISISASSFPEAFTDVNRQEIYERSLFDLVRASVGSRLIYSDRGSARAERQTGGGGTPAPRVDYATSSNWSFYRSNDDNLDRLAAYMQQANRAIASADWDGNLRIWGTQMIERTALGDTSAIVSPKRCTAARINIHLHRQAFYGDAAGLYDTDDSWSD